MRKMLKKVWQATIIRIKERKYKGRLNYLWFRNNSDSLLIVFSAFTGPKRRYNYVRGFKNIRVDKLYVLDPFAYLGSYNLYENGSDLPKVLTEGLLSEIIKKGKYKTVYTAGSSKGGTCAIYYGLEVGAEHIFSGACQYNLGSYLHRPDHEKIFLSMMGETAGEREADILNDIMPNQLEKDSNSKSVVHVFYSKKELTYQRQIVDLLNKLKECHIPYVEKEEFFEKHEDVGYTFMKYVESFFNHSDK